MFADPPWPGSALSCKSGEKRGKSVIQTKENSWEGSNCLSSMSVGIVRRRARPRAVEPPCR
jgi:hypothetical protein